MITTLNEIESQPRYRSIWDKLLLGLGKTKADDEPLNLMQILEVNGIDDAVWALCCFDYKDYCLFNADVAESVLHIYEQENTSQAPRKAINAIRDWHDGKISDERLAAASYAASCASYDSHVAAAYASYAASASASYAASYAASAHAAAAAAAWASYVASHAAAQAEKWAEIEALFIKHFGE